MAITVAKFLEGLLIEEMKIESSKVTSVVDMFNNKIKYTDKIHYVYDLSVDSNAVTRTDKYGAVSGNTHSANLADRTHKTFEFSIPNSAIIQLVIPRDIMAQTGLTPEMINMPIGTLKSVDLNKLSAWLISEFGKLAGKIKVFRLNEALDGFKNMGTSSAEDWQKPLGLPVVGDETDRPDNWTYDNKFSIAFDETAHKMAVDFFNNGQKNVYNEGVYGVAMNYLLHASSISAAGEVHLPNLTVDTYRRNTSGYLEALGQSSVSAVGTYNDSDHPNDWIALSDQADIFRLCYVNPITGTMDNMGLEMNMYYDNSKRSLVLDVMDRSCFVIASPFGILKSSVTE